MWRNRGAFCIQGLYFVTGAETPDRPETVISADSDQIQGSFTVKSPPFPGRRFGSGNKRLP
jgi:hypothetical protein